jgi:hypothetical protein
MGKKTNGLICNELSRNFRNLEKKELLSIRNNNGISGIFEKKKGILEILKSEF